ncbi:MAG: YjbH domain-containing protein [Candidatus Riflebacteria bacterium]|nr:YjbH domain-containing protein [Candidatus Riflebacteria bacterium]
MPFCAVFRLRFLIIFFAISFLCVLSSTAPSFADTGTSLSNPRFFFLGSSMIAMPTAYVNSGVEYIRDNGRSQTLYSFAPLGHFLEISDLRNLNGAYKDRNIFNLKVNILEEDNYLPNVVYGIADWNHEMGSRVFYFAASKKIEYFGVTLNAAFLRDPITTSRRPFYGIEKTVFPLISIAAERFDDRNTVGMKLRPYPGLSVEYSRRLYEPGDQQLYKLVYNKNF